MYPAIRFKADLDLFDTALFPIFHRDRMVVSREESSALIYFIRTDDPSRGLPHNFKALLIIYFLISVIIVVVVETS